MDEFGILFNKEVSSLVIVITSWMIFVIEQNSFDISPVFISMQLGTYNLANIVQGFLGGGVQG